MNAFRNDEIVILDGKPHPLVKGRLRLALDANEKISIVTEVIHFVLGVEAVVRCVATTTKGTFTAVAVATATRDPDLTEALLEVAETRSIGRALRWAGYSTDIGAEEVGGIEAVSPRSSPVPIRRGNSAPIERPPRVGAPASSAQLRCIRTLARRLGRDADAAVADVVPGADLAHLSLPDASKVIDALKAAAGGEQQADGRRAT